MRVPSKELSSHVENVNQKIASLEGSIMKAGDAESRNQQTLSKFEDQMDGLAIKIANLASQVITKFHLSTIIQMFIKNLNTMQRRFKSRR